MWLLPPSPAASSSEEQEIVSFRGCSDDDDDDEAPGLSMTVFMEFDEKRDGEIAVWSSSNTTVKAGSLIISTDVKVIGDIGDEAASVIET